MGRARLLSAVALMSGMGLGLAAAASAQDRVGGHIGVVFPLVTHVDGETVTIGDDFKIGFPMGITIKKSDTLAFDLEIVPVLDPREHGPIDVPLTIHPGILKGLGHGLTLGGRMAFDINGASWGFTPLLNKGFPVGNGLTYFVEAVVPIRFQDDLIGETHTAIGFAVHTGIAF
jgi:hypothetical protein